MSSLRNLLDGKAVDIRAGDDVYKHLEQTKKAQLKYDIAKAKLHTKLAPARKMMELVDQEHPIDENNGNPDNLQNPQVDQNGRPIPNQAAPVRPGIGQQQNNQQQPVQQKKPAFSNANRTSTSSKLAKDKDNKAKSKGKGVEIHVKAGGVGSGRHPGGGGVRRTSLTEVMQHHGFREQPSSKVRTSQNFYKSDHRKEHYIRVEKSGRWNHEWGSKHSGLQIGKAGGTNVASLKEHLHNSFGSK